jgi:hypothetical protein
MPIPRQIRWHLLLALSGAFLLTILPWQVVGTLALERGVRTGFAQTQRGRPNTPGGSLAGLPLATAAPRTATRPAFAHTRLPLAIVRRLGAECALCEGLGCGECAHSGLR